MRNSFQVLRHHKNAQLKQYSYLMFMIVELCISTYGKTICQRPSDFADFTISKTHFSNPGPLIYNAEVSHNDQQLAYGL